MEQFSNAVLGLIAFIAVLIFISLTATAIFRPSKLADLIEAYKVIGLALIGRQTERRKRKNEEREGDDEAP